ncbi:aspartate carbamoyltransferase [Streptomyces sp. NPDC051771]|uniref:aspartate carbamoyltransferase n=1 Tax=Streptomyces sp. NPDC051771 TaxID=3154847 RepID=UPI003434C060
MPFDLDRTTHRFTPTADGLLEEVVADAPEDAEQVRLIREHLTHEAERFRKGEYDDPAAIHGTAMPGLRQLATGAEHVDITYSERPDGAALRFRTADATLMDALHRWGAAQTSDHGEHAEH